MNYKNIQAKVKKLKMLNKVGMATLIASFGLTAATGVWVASEVSKFNNSSFDIELMQREEMSGYSNYVLTIARGYYNQYKEGKITAEQYDKLTNNLNSQEMLYDYASSLNDDDINRMLEERFAQEQDLKNTSSAIVIPLLGIGTVGFGVSSIAQKKLHNMSLQAAMAEVKEDSELAD